MTAPNVINIGGAANDGTGDSFRAAFAKANKLLGAWYNPISEGCAGDLLTDDTAALQALITKCRANNQSGIMLPRDYDYLISAPLDVSGVSLVGVGGGSIAPFFQAASNFVGSSLLLLSGDTSGGAGRCTYENFWVKGGKTVVSGVIDGIRLHKGVYFNTFKNVNISDCSGAGLRLSGTAGLRPSVNTFDTVRVTECNGDGFEIRAGVGNHFRCCDAEGNYLKNLDVSSADESVARTTFAQFWSEKPGFTTSLGQNVTGQTGIYLTGDKNILDRCFSASYGISPVGAGHGIHVQDAVSCTIDSCDIAQGNSGASGASSKCLFMAGGSRNKIKNLPGNVTAADLSIGPVDTVIENSYANAVVDVIPVVTSNSGTALTGGTTTYYQPMTGLDDAVEANMAVPAPGRMHFCNLYCRAGSDPGAGQSYTITLFKNGSAQLMEVILTTANWTGAVDSSNEVDLVLGDKYSFRCIASATATTQARGRLQASVGLRR